MRSTGALIAAQASMPAICVKLAVQELELVISRVICVARSARMTP